MSKIVLQDISTGYELGKINDNFTKIKDFINDEALSRSNPSLSANNLEVDLDADGNTIYNVDELHTDAIYLNGQLLVPSDEVSLIDDVLRDDLAANHGAQLVGYGGTTVDAYLDTLDQFVASVYPSVGYNAVVDFNVDNTGATNCTTQLLAFYNACIADQRNGYIPAGTYLVTAGVLIFNTSGIADKTWPNINTAGYNAVTFKRASTTNAPMIQWTNGTALSAVGKYWKGGSHGGITIDQNGMATSAGQHGLSLRGMFGTKFGWMRINDGGGSGIHIPQTLYGGTNPDPYAVTFCKFEGVEANRCKLFIVQNENFVGLNLCYFENIRGIECEGGGFFGFGAANTVGFASMGTIKGWAFDDGCALSNIGGSPSRFTLLGAELDDVQYGFRLNKTSLSSFKNTRLVHRYQFSALNPSGGYWPRKAVEAAGGVLPSVNGIDLDLTHRIEIGGLKASMGVFFDGSSDGNITNLELNQRVIDNAGFGFADNELYTNLNNIASLRLKRDGYVIDSRIPRTYVRANASGSLAISNAGYTTVKVPFTSEISDRLGLWSTDTFTVKKAGDYRIKAKVCLTLSAGKQVRIAAMVNTSAAADNIMFATGASAQHYILDDIVTLAVGDTLWFSVDQNHAASVTVSTPINAGIDNHIIIEAIDG